MAITLLEDIVNRFIVNSPADHTVEEYSGNTNVSAINSVLVYSRKENVKVFARVTATQVWETLGVVGNDLNAVSGHGTEYRKDAVFNVTTMDRVSIISLGAETTARIVFNPSLPTEALSNATPSGGSTTSQTAVSDMAQDQIETITIDSGTTPIIQIFEDTVIPGAGSTELDVLRLHLDSDFTDSSTSGHTVTAVGNTAISTSEKKFGAGSAYFDGSGDYLAILNSNDLSLAGEDFTIESWFYSISNGVPGNIFRLSQSWGDHLLAMTADHPQDPLKSVVWSKSISCSSAALVSTTDIAEGVWYHLALTREGSTLRLFINGVLEDSITNFTTQIVNTQDKSLYIGAHDGQLYPDNNSINGHIDDFRITKGLARYTENFTVPAAAHPDANAADTTRTLDKSSTYEIEHASDTTVEVKKLTAGSADVKIRLI